MQITVVVCDRCEARHELDPEHEGHGHVGPVRLPPGWMQIAVSRCADAETEEPEAPHTAPDPPPEQREIALRGLRYMVGVLEDPAVTGEVAKHAMRTIIDQWSPAVGRDPLSDMYRRAAGHGEHLPIEERSGVFCKTCAPTLTGPDGAPFTIPERLGYGTIMHAPRM